jgi:hypothetical protein
MKNKEPYLLSDTRYSVKVISRPHFQPVCTPEYGNQVMRVLLAERELIIYTTGSQTILYYCCAGPLPRCLGVYEDEHGLRFERSLTYRRLKNLGKDNNLNALYLYSFVLQTPKKISTCSIFLYFMNF